MKRLVVWFSCGAASAVSVKTLLSKYAGEYEIAVARCVVKNEHVDNDRFAADCEKWFGVPIVPLSSEKYEDCWDVWEDKRFLKGIHGAPCTTELKRKVRHSFERDWLPSVQAYGYTSEEQDRADIFRDANPSVVLSTPLIDENISKADCLAIIQDAGIELPMMYQLGFNNNNCVGCVKGGMGYWNRIRKVFPDVFDRMASLERELNHAILRSDGVPLFLDELSPDAGRHNEPEIDCSMFCMRVEMLYALSRSGAR